MPWLERSLMDVRLRFVQDVHRPGWSIAEVCRRYQVSRKTGYKWLERYEKAGPAGLVDRSHRPYSCPHATPGPIVQQILALQRRFRWGARKVRWLLAKRVPSELVPTVATVHRILERHGRTGRRRPSRRRFHAGRPDTPLDQPNAIWSADFKGQFRTGNGIYCYPLTIQDAATRFLLGCRGLLKPTIDASWPVFQRLFRRYGLPERIRTDNGAPFASCALGRLSMLSVWWIRLGIQPRTPSKTAATSGCTRPSRPRPRGRHAARSPPSSDALIGFARATTRSDHTKRSASGCPQACTTRRRGPIPARSCRSATRGIMKCGV